MLCLRGLLPEKGNICGSGDQAGYLLVSFHFGK